MKKLNPFKRIRLLKLTHLKSSSETDDYLVLIPGGPGISSLTLRSLDHLKSSFHLIYLDFQGTNDTAFDPDLIFDDLVNIIANTLITKIPLEANIYLIGHSYGGLIATAVGLQIKVKGLFCLSTPFSTESFNAASINYKLKLTPSLSEAEDKWNLEKTNKLFKDWLAEYGELYFLKKGGKELILNDKASALFFMSKRPNISYFENILSKIAKLPITKIFIAGKQDSLLPHEQLIKDSQKGQFQFYIIEDSSHFLTHDQPEEVANLIETIIKSY